MPKFIFFIPYYTYMRTYINCTIFYCGTKVSIPHPVTRPKSSGRATPETEGDVLTLSYCRPGSDKSYVYSEFDYYKQHTRQCKACSSALRRFKMMRPIVATAAAALLTMGRIAMTRLIPSAPILVHSSAPFLLAVACGMLWRQIGVWEQALGGGRIAGAAGHHEF